MLDLIQGKLSLKATKRFNQRKFTISPIGPTMGVPETSFTIPNASIEGFRANSFTNITTTPGVTNGHIRVMTYEQWRKTWPDPSKEALGPPRFLIPLPDDGSGDCNVTLFPYPDQAYTIEGICRIVYQKIVDGSTPTIFPVMYEHALIFAGMGLLETRMNEGREASMMALADAAIEEVMRDSEGADEEVDPIEPGVRLRGFGGDRRYVRDYNPDTDVVPPYTG